MERVQEKEAERRADNELYARLTAPEHERESSFREHERVEGYMENREAPGYIQCDRLLRLDTLYGTIQLGYNPRRNASFLFANIKTSIFDTAASRYQREIKEQQMLRHLKRETQNVSYTARRKKDSSTVIYLFENKPWSVRSVSPYIKYADPGTLAKTMPFLGTRKQRERQENLRGERRDLQENIAECLRTPERDGEELIRLRRRDTELIAEQNLVNALLTRQLSRSHHFFRRVNLAYDLQKHEMFTYYRSLQKGESERVSGMAAPDTEEDDNA